MPSIHRQKPPLSPKPVSSFPQGSVLATAKPVNSLKEKYVRVCIYGRNRSGKTTLAAQFAKPMLIVSAEPDECGGATSISNIDGIIITRISASRLEGDTVHGSAKVVAIANELAHSNPFKTVVLDTCTSLQDIILVELMGLPAIPEMMSWGVVPDGVYQARAEKLRETIRPLLKLNNCNIVILAQEADHNAQEDRGGRRKLMQTMQAGSFIAPALGATNAKWLQDNCGYVVQIYEDELMQEIVIPQFDGHGKPIEPVTQQVGTGKRQRHLRLLYHPNFAAGGRWNFDPNMPEFVTAPTPKELYEKMAVYIPALKG